MSSTASKAGNYLFDLFRSGMRSPDHVLMEIATGGDITYGVFERQSARYANVLARLGVKRGDRVAVQAEKSAEFVFLYAACLRAGAIFLPLNTAYTPAEIDYFLSDSEPVLFVCDRERRDVLYPIARSRGVLNTVCLDDQHDSLRAAALDAPDRCETVACGPDDLAAILYTSGTTGRSKGAMLSHGNLGSNAATLAAYWKFSTDDVLIHALPLFHAHGLFVGLNVTLVAGSRMIFLQKFDPDQIVLAMARATVLMGVPTFYTRLLQHPGLTRESTSRMRLFISGSAPLLPDTHMEWLARTGHAILERYGMTETIMNTSNPYNGERSPGTVGFPLPGIALRITDAETGRPLLPDQIGIIEVRGPNLFKGYWRMPEKTASEFRPDGFFITGDLGKIDQRGYVHIVGRSKDLIISGGYNVYPKEVEVKINEIAGVVESAIIGVPHSDFGEAVTAIVVRSADADITAESVRSHLEQQLARYKLPKRVVFVESLPRNTMAKVQKSLLRERYARLFIES